MQVYALLHGGSPCRKQHVDIIATQGAAGSPKAYGSKIKSAAVAGWNRAGHLLAQGKGLQGVEPQGCAESKAISQRDQMDCSCCYRTGHGRGCAAANKLVEAEQISSLQGTAEPQVPSVINFSFLQLHQPFWCISSRGRTSDSLESGGLLAQMHPQRPSRCAT